MYLYIYILLIAFLSVNCQVTRNSTQILTNEKNSTQVLKNENASNATKTIVIELVNGMGRALQHFLSSNSMNIISSNKQETDTVNSTLKPESYQIEGEKLREEIIKRVNQLQTVLVTGIQVAKDRRDVMSRRILEQANTRLEHAKDRADHILREPTNSEIAVRTLRTINNGISQLSQFINSVLSKVNISINVNVKDKTQ